MFLRGWLASLSGCASLMDLVWFSTYQSVLQLYMFHFAGYLGGNSQFLYMWLETRWCYVSNAHHYHSHELLHHIRFESACAVIQSYSHALLCRDRIDGSLRGFIGFHITRKKSHTIIRVGLTLCKQEYTGGPYMYITFGYVLMRGKSILGVVAGNTDHLVAWKVLTKAPCLLPPLSSFLPYLSPSSSPPFITQSCYLVPWHQYTWSVKSTASSHMQ